jgi:hypothetical protein
MSENLLCTPFCLLGLTIKSLRRLDLQFRNGLNEPFLSFAECFPFVSLRWEVVEVGHVGFEQARQTGAETLIWQSHPTTHTIQVTITSSTHFQIELNPSGVPKK